MSRFHFLAQGKQKTLCGARILECGTPNAPVFTDSISSFEGMPQQNRCIKCGKLLIRHKMVRARNQARQVQQTRLRLIDGMWDEFKRRVERVEELLQEGEPDAETAEQTPQHSG